MQRARKVGLVALAAFVLLVLGVSAAWAVDARSHDGTVARNVTLGGRDVSGMGAEEVRRIVDDLATRYPSTPVRIDDGEGGFTTTAGELGARVDREATLRNAMAAGKRGNVLGRIAGWTVGFVDERDAGVEVELANATVYDTVRRHDTSRKDAVEPSLAVREGELIAVAGKPGRGVDPADVIEALPDVLADTGPGDTAVVEVERGSVLPRFGIDRARVLVGRAEELLDGGLKVRAGTASATIPEKTLRAWLTTRAGVDDLELAIDPGEAEKGLPDLLPRAGREAVSAGFRVVGGTVTITAARNGTACCDDEAPELVLQGMSDGSDAVVELPLEPVEPRRTEQEARALRIAEPVGSFTTNHKCCEARVRNIHRIADILRGHVIDPGETFSINDTVGRRTTAKGFVSAGVIENGRLTEDIGGGISQFATTMFNAAFFAGLEFGEYQSHSLYISRYPYGREATMGYPRPDLQVKNVTPYGILVWPSYTERSITVTLYSTKHFRSVDQTGQSKRPQGTCTVVTTERTRVLPDGERKVDSVRARYRREEGLNCDGTQTPPPTNRP